MFSSTLQLLQACIFGLTLIVISTAIRNVWLHPLRSFPGPRLCAASRLPYLYHKLRGTYFREVLRMFEAYGPVVRVAPDELAFADSDAWKDIYGLLPGRKQNPKDLNVWPPKQKGWNRAIPLASDVDHSQLKRALAPAFTPTAIRESEYILIKYVDQLCARLRSLAASSPSGVTSQDLCQWFDFLTFDITGEVGFSEHLQCIEKARHHPWIKTIMESLPFGCMLTQLNRYGVVSAIQAVIPERVLLWMNKPAQYASMIVQQRLQRDRDSITPTRDIFAAFLSSEKHGLTLERCELEMNATFLVMGGGETVAALLSGAIYFLCLREDALKRLQRELRTTFDSSDRMNNDALMSLKYLTAVLNECLRIFPPTPEGTPRILSGACGQNIAGRWVPAGTSCAVHPWAANHFTGNFHRPHDFLPERWLGELVEGAKDDLSASQPFSTGPRSCIGMHLALAEIRLALAKMLWGFEIELDTCATATEHWSQSVKVYGAWERPPLMVLLKPPQ